MLFSYSITAIKNTLINATDAVNKSLSSGFYSAHDCPSNVLPAGRRPTLRELSPCPNVFCPTLTYTSDAGYSYSRQHDRRHLLDFADCHEELVKLQIPIRASYKLVRAMVASQNEPLLVGYDLEPGPRSSFAEHHAPDSAS